VRGEVCGDEPVGEAASYLHLKKKAYATAGMLVPLSTVGVTIAGVLTDESGEHMYIYIDR